MENLELHTFEETMKILRSKDKRTIKRLMKSGKLPYREHGKKILFASEDIADYIRSCRRVGRKDEPKNPIDPTNPDLRQATETLLLALAGFKSALMR